MTAGIALRACTDADWQAFETTMQSAFGNEMNDAGRQQWRRILNPDQMLVATEQDGAREAVVGTAAWLPFDMTVPGGEVPVAAITMVTVRPTHRRRGILRQMMRHQLDDAHQRGVPVATLWASESGIYRRFGYGHASTKGRIEIEPRRARFLGSPDPVGRARLLDEAEALDVLPEVYERARREIPASFKRPRVWWEQRKLPDLPVYRGGGGPMGRMVLEIDGRPEGYALYRIFPGFDDNALPIHALEVLEAVGTSPTATREVWRYLFGVDLIARVRTYRLNAEHPLSLMLTDPRQLRMTVADATWARLVDIGRALTARRYQAEEALTFEFIDDFCAWNTGVWTLDASPGGATLSRSEAGPMLRFSAAELASMYLGTVSCTRLLRAGRLDELAPGAALRADRLFWSDVAPWCLDDF